MPTAYRLARQLGCRNGPMRQRATRFQHPFIRRLDAARHALEGDRGYHTQQAGSASDVTSGASVVVLVTTDGGLRGLFGQGGNGGTVTLPAGDVTVTGR